ncbi:hypothetical protein LTR81_027030, partial [Elasticomyces elasticus]
MTRLAPAAAFEDHKDLTSSSEPLQSITKARDHIANLESIDIAADRIGWSGGIEREGAGRRVDESTALNTTAIEDMGRSPVRRDDDRHVGRDNRDNRDSRYRRSRSRDREVRRRSRSPGGRDLTRTQRRYDDRDRGHGGRDRSRDRYEPRPLRDSRDRIRKRSRDYSPVRGGGRRDYNDYYNDYDNNARKRSRRDSSLTPRRSRDNSKDRVSHQSSSVRGNESLRPDVAEDAEKDKRDKLAKVALWKKENEERQRKLRGELASPAVKTEVTDRVPSPTKRGPSSPAKLEPAPPARYAGKFDPKAIAKRAAAKLAQSRAALDSGAVMPKSANAATMKT